MKTNLPQSINTIKEAKIFLSDLYNNGESYHPEDDAKDCLEGIATKEETELLNKLMQDIYNLNGNNNNHSNPVFDPCEFLLMLSEGINESNFHAKYGKALIQAKTQDEINEVNLYFKSVQKLLSLN